MNEVSQVRPGPAMALPATLNKTDVNRKQLEKTQPVVASAETEVAPSADIPKASNEQKNKQLSEALGTMQDFVQNVKRELQFSVDQDLGRTVVKVVDSESGDLIRQIPEEIFLDLARKVKEQGEVNLFNATG